MAAVTVGAWLQWVAAGRRPGAPPITVVIAGIRAEPRTTPPADGAP
ncbi:hypothetical protein [Streptomyces sp. 3211]|nr:hypothetical protein [Streptomyces sp. 3211]